MTELFAVITLLLPRPGTTEIVYRYDGDYDEPGLDGVAVGPDGAFYVSELKGFPAPQGMSRVWRIEPDARHEDCGVSPKCSVVADGFTSIIDLAFGRDGSLYVVEFDEATWAAVEFGLGGQGGTVNKCNLAAGTCEEIASGLPLPVAVALTRDGTLYAIINALVPGAAQVITLP